MTALFGWALSTPRERWLAPPKSTAPAADFVIWHGICCLVGKAQASDFKHFSRPVAERMIWKLLPDL